MPSSLGAVGVGVSDMSRSVKFYSEQLGYKPTQAFDVPDFYETVMAFPYGRGGSAIVLMQYKQPVQLANRPGKLVFYVEDVKAQMEKLRAYGCEMVLEVGQGEGDFLAAIGMAKDPDGFLLEFMPTSFLKKGSKM